MYSSQSATSCYQECPRKRLFQYHLLDTGIVPLYSSIPLTTGGCVHLGIQTICEGASVDDAVKVAQVAYRNIVHNHPLSKSGELPEQQSYTLQEQLALTEGLVRLWYMYEYPKLNQFYSVIAIEQEITFPLADNIIYQSRPDLILQDKRNGDIVNYSIKTIKQWNDIIERSYKIQLQCSTEPFATGIWLQQLNETVKNLIESLGMLPQNKHVQAIVKYLENGWLHKLPDHSSSIRFCYLIKGDRKEDEKGSGNYRTDSPLIYGWRKFNPGGIEYAASAWTNNPNNKSGFGTLGKGWEKFSVWDNKEVGGVKGWMEMIRKGERVENNIGEGNLLENRILSLADVYINPSIYQDRLSEIRETESRVEEGLHLLQTANIYDKANKQTILHILQTFFPCNTNSCYFPSQCEYLTICPNGNDLYREHIASDPINPEYGMYERRIPHHLPEKEFIMSSQRVEQQAK